MWQRRCAGHARARRSRQLTGRTLIVYAFYVVVTAPLAGRVGPERPKLALKKQGVEFYVIQSMKYQTFFFFLRQLAHALEFLVGLMCIYTSGSLRISLIASLADVGLEVALESIAAIVDGG